MRILQSHDPAPGSTGRSSGFPRRPVRDIWLIEIFTSRENVALSREALRSVLAEGNLILRPDVANACLEGTLTISR